MNESTTIYFFIEGEDDERFIERIIKKILEKDGFTVGTYSYAEEKPEKIKNFYRNIKKFCNTYFLADFNNSPCITARKQEINKKYGIDLKDITIVKPEIEAWYLAGITNNNTKIPKRVLKTLPTDCETITKEKFNQYIPKHLERRAFMNLILSYYDLKVAVTKNKSLRRFIVKILKIKNLIFNI